MYDFLKSNWQAIDYGLRKLSVRHFKTRKQQIFSCFFLMSVLKSMIVDRLIIFDSEECFLHIQEIICILIKR